VHWPLFPRRVSQIRCCEVCRLPIFLDPSESVGLCGSCELSLTELAELDVPCERCGRRHTYQFRCGWCARWVCDNCVNSDHDDDDDCTNPDDD
jgi:hypothetical protein